MKKFLAAALALAMALSVTACSNQQTPTTSTPSTSTPEVSTPADSSEPANAGYTFSGTITIIVPFNAGSNTDNQIRFLQPYLEKHLGANTIIVNNGGASGTIGTTDFLTQSADGNTILFSLPTPTVYRPASGDLTYTTDDLIPVARVSADPLYLAVSAENDNFNNGQDVIDYIKANPGKFTYANAGNGGIAHLAFAAFLSDQGLDALSVPFTGGTADCYTAVMGGHVMSHSVSEADLVGRTDYKVLINLGSKSTSEGFADIPTLADLGYEGYVTDTFAAFYYMKGVDSAVVEAFDAAVAATLSDPEFIAAAEEANFAYRYAGSEELTGLINDTVELVTPILAELNEG